jgi:O-antigen/teichoic acid export membrane protein
VKLPSLFGGASIYVVANIVNAAIPFLLLPILTRYLSPADYGMVAMFMISLSVFGAFCGLSVHGAISVKYFRLSEDDLAEYVGACTLVVLGATLLVGLVVFALGDILVPLIGVPAGWLISFVIVAGVQTLFLIRLTLWQVAGEPLRYGAFQIGQSLVNAGLSVVLVVVAGMAWEGRVLGQIVAIVVCGALAMGLLVNDRRIAFPRRNSSFYRDALEFGLPLIPHSLGWLIVISADRVLITDNLGLAATGIYTVALQIAQGVSLITEAFNRSYAPWLMGRLVDADAETNRLLVRGTWTYFAVALFGATIYGLCANVAVPYLLGDSYASTGGLVIYLALGFALTGCYQMVANYIFFQGKTFRLALVTLFTGAISIPILLGLIRANGLDGAAQAFVVNGLIYFLLAWWLSNITHPMPWFCFRAVGRSAAFGLQQNNRKKG